MFALNLRECAWETVSSLVFALPVPQLDVVPRKDAGYHVIALLDLLNLLDRRLQQCHS